MKTLLSEVELRQGVDRLSRQIIVDWGQRPMTIVGVLTGCVVFLADLIRRLDVPLRVDLIQASSYRGATTRSDLIIHAGLQPEIGGRDVLLVDDIFDTGHTLVKVVAELRRHGPASLRTAVLLYKEGRREVDFEPDFVAFRIPNQFVVGYGLDYRDEYRNLPYLAILEPDDLGDRPHGELGVRG
ncbi:MAG: hypoxanthine phosphoribosyltransferase [Planctomycetes bacterium]|nr:hypoxanthine phosphoribosyltransferase [Planctomycetota bacterium]